MSPTVWLKPGILTVYGAALDAGKHSHNAIQVVWPSGKSLCRFDGYEINGPLIINAQVEHQLQMDAGWILLVEPKSDIGQQLCDILNQQPASSIPGLGRQTKISPKHGDDLSALLSPLFSALALDTTLIESNTSSALTDKRIQNLLTELDQCLLGDCLKPSSWRASEIAGRLALSESRFLHLFREQMGIAWRPYLLWRRTICAINAISKDQSATEAAHLSGFSDSAHLSRTFRSLFGITIREAKHLVAPS